MPATARTTTRPDGSGAGLKDYVADTAVSWPGRLSQILAFFRNRSPSQMPATAAPWTSPWLPPVTNRTSGIRLGISPARETAQGIALIYSLTFMAGFVVAPQAGYLPADS